MRLLNTRKLNTLIISSIEKNIYIRKHSSSGHSKCIEHAMTIREWFEERDGKSKNFYITCSIRIDTCLIVCWYEQHFRKITCKKIAKRDTYVHNTHTIRTFIVTCITKSSIPSNSIRKQKIKCSSTRCWTSRLAHRFAPFQPIWCFFSLLWSVQCAYFSADGVMRMNWTRQYTRKAEWIHTNGYSLDKEFKEEKERRSWDGQGMNEYQKTSEYVCWCVY